MYDVSELHVPDTTNQIKVSGNSILNTTVFPDTKLQTLDRRVGKDQLYFDRKQFEKSLKSWTGTAVIYQKDGVHPTDFEAVIRDPVMAAEAIGGRFVGTVSNPRIVVPGGARLMAELDIDEDEDEILKLWQEGRLFPSTAFTASSDGDRITSPPVPNHVLLFPIEVDKVLPGDFGAFVNTLEVQSMKDEKQKKKSCNVEPVAGWEDPNAPEETPVEEVKQAVEEVTEDVAEVAQDVDTAKSEIDLLREEITLLKAELAFLKEQAGIKTAEVAPAETQATPNEEQPAEVTNTESVEASASADVVVSIDEEIKWRDEEIARLKAEVEAFQAGKKALEEKIAGLEATALEAEFEGIVEQLPAGMKATPEQVEALHSQYIKGDVKAMLHSVLAINAASGATAKVGQPFTQSNIISDSQPGVGNLNKPKNRG